MSCSVALASLVVAASVCVTGHVMAAGLTTHLPNGQTLSVVESSTATREGFSFVRRNPDGARDRQFGPGGRVSFEMGGNGGIPAAIRADASGNIYVAGTAESADRSRGGVVLRFLSTGQIDSRWGDQGQARLPAASGDSFSTDVLPLSDASVLVVGTVEDKGSQQASIWRLAASGRVDPSFGQRGVMLATALPLSRVLSIQQGPEGELQLAVQSVEGGKSWLEMHRWPSGDATPRRVARQELPDQWVGPASLVRQNGRWFWLDPSQPDSPVAVAMSTEADSPWVRPGPPPTAAAEVSDPPGHAAVNPYAGAATEVASEPAETPGAAIWLAILAVTALGLGAAIKRVL